MDKFPASRNSANKTGMVDGIIDKLSASLSLENVVHIVVRAREITGFDGINLEEKMGFFGMGMKTDIFQSCGHC